MKTRMIGIASLMLMCSSVSAKEPEVGFIPERFNKPPRILFNLSDPKSTITELVPGEFYQDFWQGVRMTVIRGYMIMKDQPTFETKPGYHGEELIILMEGQLTFTFPDSGKSYTMKSGDVMHFNNVLHHGVCESKECYYLGVLSPPRLDYGDEGAGSQSIDSNVAIKQLKKGQ